MMPKAAARLIRSCTPRSCARPLHRGQSHVPTLRRIHATIKRERTDVTKVDGFSGLAQFFETKHPPRQKIQHGRAWTPSDLRHKSFQDLHKLWFVLYKERNMLYTEEFSLAQQKLVMFAPERIVKVQQGMNAIKKVLMERTLHRRLMEVKLHHQASKMREERTAGQVKNRRQRLLDAAADRGYNAEEEQLLVQEWLGLPNTPEGGRAELAEQTEQRRAEWRERMLGTGREVEAGPSDLSDQELLAREELGGGKEVNEVWEYTMQMKKREGKLEGNRRQRREKARELRRQRRKEARKNQTFIDEGDDSDED